MLSAAATEALAVGVLGGAALGVILWAAAWARRWDYTPGQAAIFGLSHFVARTLWRARIEGRFPVPPGQGAIIICNHRSSSDPAFIALAAGRPVHWMVAKEYYVHPWMGRLLRICGTIPVNRGGIDTAATRAAIRCVRAGGLLGLFPEGRINTTEQLLLPARPGVALIALKARVPVVPCYVSGSAYDGTTFGCLRMPAAVRLRIGRPLDLSAHYGRERQRDVLKRLTTDLLREIAGLAGRPDFQPRLAGRFYRPDALGQGGGTRP